MKKFECYEDNGGGLYLFILNDEGKAIAGYGNFEYGEGGELAEAIAEIDNHNLFGGDFGGDIDMPMHYVVTEDGEDVADRELTIDEVYREYGEDETSTLIAWSEGENVNYCDKNHMGYAARKALNITKD